MIFKILAFLALLHPSSEVRHPSVLIEKLNQMVESNRRDSVNYYNQQLSVFVDSQDSLLPYYQYFQSEALLNEVPLESEKLAKEALKGFSDSEGRLIYRIKSLKVLGNCAKFLSNYEQSIDYFQQAISIAESRKSSEVFSRVLPILYYNLGAVQRDYSRYEEALIAFQQAEQLAAKWDISIVLASSCIQSAAVFFELGNYQKAKDYFDKASAISGNQLPAMLGYIYNGLGMVY